MKCNGIFILAFCCLSALTGAAWPQETLTGRPLVEALRQGGFNIYFRHAATDWSRTDNVAKEGDWKTCDPEKMRQLSAEGRATACRIGTAIRNMKIPVGQVWSSEYCRTLETARLLNLGSVATTRDIMNTRAAEFVGGHDALVQRARRALSTPPPKGTNTVFVAHGNIVRAATGAYPVEAGAVIFAPRGNGALEVIVMLDPGDWDLLYREISPEEMINNKLN